MGAKGFKQIFIWGIEGEGGFVSGTASPVTSKKIAIPPLGCGNGGLVWAGVKPLIVTKNHIFP